MTPAQHVRASTELGPAGLLLCAVTLVAAIVCSALTLPVWVIVAMGSVATLVAWAICRMGALCDMAEDEHREAFNDEHEPWVLPHMNNQPNDARM